jgi:fibrillarin-like rRNA methylase
VQLLAIFLGIAWGVCYQGIAEGSYLSHFSNVLRYGVVFGVLSVPLTPTITLSVMAARRAAPA